MLYQLDTDNLPDAEWEVLSGAGLYVETTDTRCGELLGSVSDPVSVSASLFAFGYMEEPIESA